MIVTGKSSKFSHQNPQNVRPWELKGCKQWPIPFTDKELGGNSYNLISVFLEVILIWAESTFTYLLGVGVAPWQETEKHKESRSWMQTSATIESKIQNHLNISIGKGIKKIQNLASSAPKRPSTLCGQNVSLHAYQKKKKKSLLIIL